MTTIHKVCPRCGLDLLLDHFTVDAAARDGHARICRHCIREDRREAAQSDEDAALQARLDGRGVVTIAAAYRKGREEGAAAAVRALKRAGRLRHSDDAAEAQARAERIAAMADEALNLPHTPKATGDGPEQAPGEPA
jgi:hypothetical protein